MVDTELRKKSNELTRSLEKLTLKQSELEEQISHTKTTVRQIENILESKNSNNNLSKDLNCNLITQSEPSIYAEDNTSVDAVVSLTTTTKNNGSQDDSTTNNRNVSNRNNMQTTGNRNIHTKKWTLTF